MKRVWAGCAVGLLLDGAVFVIGQTTGPAPRPVPPPRGDETSLTKLQASLADYVDVPFFSIVGLRIDHYYNWGYEHAQNTHYSLEGLELTKEGKRTGNSIRLYARRGEFDGVSSAVIDATKDSMKALKLARVKAVIKRERYEPQMELMAELVDVQFASEDGSTWGKWEVAASSPSPPEPKGEAVKVWWRGGKSPFYHLRTCPEIKDVKEPRELTLPEAAAKKLKPCKKCAPPALPGRKEEAQSGQSNSREPIPVQQQRS